MSRQYRRHPVIRWKPENWQQAWAIRGPKTSEPETIRRRNEIQAFRVELAKKEPKS